MRSSLSALIASLSVAIHSATAPVAPARCVVSYYYGGLGEVRISGKGTVAVSEIRRPRHLNDAWEVLSPACGDRVLIRHEREYFISAKEGLRKLGKAPGRFVGWWDGYPVMQESNTLFSWNGSSWQRGTKPAPPAVRLFIQRGIDSFLTIRDSAEGDTATWPVARTDIGYGPLDGWSKALVTVDGRLEGGQFALTNSGCLFLALSLYEESSGILVINLDTLKSQWIYQGYTITGMCPLGDHVLVAACDWPGDSKRAHTTMFGLARNGDRKELVRVRGEFTPLWTIDSHRVLAVRIRSHLGSDVGVLRVPTGAFEARDYMVDEWAPAATSNAQPKVRRRG